MTAANVRAKLYHIVRGVVRDPRLWCCEQSELSSTTALNNSNNTMMPALGVPQGRKPALGQESRWTAGSPLLAVGAKTATDGEMETSEAAEAFRPASISIPFPSSQAVERTPSANDPCLPPEHCNSSLLCMWGRCGQCTIRIARGNWVV